MVEPAQPLISRGKSLLDQLLGIAQTRLELLSAELQHEKVALMRQWQFAVGAVVCICLAGVTLIVLLAITLPPSSRVTVLTVVLAFLVGGAIGCIVALKTRAKRAPLFSRVIHQLRLDRNSLGEGS